MTRHFLSLLLVTYTLAGCAVPDDSPVTATADLLLTNGRVYTFTWDDPAPDGTPAATAPFHDGLWRPDAEAVAVHDGRILFVGSAADAEVYSGESTQVLDLAGATVLPGLVDSHTHVAELGARLLRVDLVGAKSEEEIVERVAARTATTPPGEWIIGWGWDEGAWADRYPTLDLLSERVPDHPVVLRSLHGFAVLANRQALETAGIDRDTPTPTGGEIRKDADGEPTGIFLNRATTLLNSAVPAPSPEALADQVLAGLEEMARSGYVAVHDAGVDDELMAAFEALETSGRLPIRVEAMLSARDADQCRAWIARGPDTEGMLTRRSVKAYYDGALGSRGARLLEDYSDQAGHRGISGAGYGFDQELVTELIGAGFQAAIHAIGDAGNREVLDFFANAFNLHPQRRAGRHRIEHAQVLHPDDIPRFAELGVVASMQPPHAVEDMAWAEDRLGAQRVQGAYAWRTLRRSGAQLIFNSDLAGSDHDIFYGLHAAMTRRGKNLEPAGGWLSEEATTPEEAVRAYTVWPAWAVFEDDDAGQITPGWRADLSVLDIDPLAVGLQEPGRLLEGKVLWTVAGGEIVHAAR